MDSVTKASVESVTRKITSYLARPLTEFNKYEVLELLETLQNTASECKHEKSNFYRLAHVTARKNIDYPRPQFHSLVARLVGDKDQEKIQDIETKVAKAFRQSSQRREGGTSYAGGFRYGSSAPNGGSRYNRRDSRPYPSSSRSVICFQCGKSGHVKASCPEPRAETKSTPGSKQSKD